MRFYRIQDVEGVGPYHNGDAVWNDDEERHPAPGNDGLRRAGGNWYDPAMDVSEVCGFVSMDALREWFDEEMLNILADMDRYLLCTFEVNHAFVREGYRQAVAVREAMQEVSFMTVAEYLEL